jgi:ABC-type nitrate/sulfonate/bicarbonate transport system permease component
VSRRARRLATVLELAVPAALLAAWAVTTSYYLPPPTRIAEAFGDTWLFARVRSDVVPSLLRLAAGYVGAGVPAVGAGLLLSLVPWLRRAADPVVQFLRAIPPPVLLPLGILVLGVGDAMKVVIIAFVCVWPVLLNTMDGIAGVDPMLLDTARVYRLGARDRIVHLLLPAAAPQIFAGLRTSLSLSLILMVISEMVASTNGIGYFVLQSQRTFAIPEMWSGIALLSLLGYVLNQLFGLVERRVLRRHRGARTLI